MSFDLYLEADLGGPEPVSLCSWDFNCTYNLTPMIRLAFEAPENEGTKDIFDQRVAGELLEHVGRAIERMRALPDLHRALNPPNGWGTYEGLLEFLERLRDACAAAPRARVRWSG